MKPMVEWIIEFIGKGINLSRELSLKSREYVVELKGVGIQVYPSRVSCEDGKSLTRPKSVVWSPVSNIWNEFLSILVKSFQITLPLKSSFLSKHVLQDD